VFAGDVVEGDAIAADLSRMASALAVLTKGLGSSLLACR
jgi:hypothetical protein